MKWALPSALGGLLLLSACTTELQVASDGRSGPTVAGPAEKAYCSTSQTSGFGTAVTITGTAHYLRREATSSGLGSAAAATSHPIRRAEVRITNASGATINCGETSNTGTFSIQVERNIGATYTVWVASRSENEYLRASVMNRPESKAAYYLSDTVDVSANDNVVLVAAADGNTYGGAFHILDMLLLTNEYLVAQTGTGTLCSTNFPGCWDVTESILPASSRSGTLPKVEVYWEKGFNPNDYFDGSGGLSFYLPGYSRMFILGGINGDTDNTDTDHYDPSIIIHEYGHFLEDAVSMSDSPGGGHTGDGVIDPRLAWSEGWGNFIQAAVRGSPDYIDTEGNADGNTQAMINFNLETATFGKDLPTAAGEGNFRELSVTRLLYDAVDAAADGADNLSGSFQDIWASLTKQTRGMADSTFAFRSVGSLHLAQGWLETIDGDGDNWSGIRTQNLQDGDTSRYGQLLSTTCPGVGGHTGDFTIDPEADGASTLSESHLFKNNRFYHLRVTSAGTKVITMYYSDANSAGIEADLDLYIYNESARFAVTADMKSYSRLDPAAGFGVETETFSVYLPVGNYLLAVNAYTGGGLGGAGPTNYYFELGGIKLCPADLVQ